MERIGIAASKIARGNLFLYNFYVVLISSLLSLLMFVLAGSSVMLALLLIGTIINGFLPENFEKEWTSIIRICMIFLTIIISLFNLSAILKNIKLVRHK